MLVLLCDGINSLATGECDFDFSVNSKWIIAIAAMIIFSALVFR